jgi:putative transposase
MKFKFMNEHKNKFGLKRMCEVFLVSRSGFYAWIKRPQSKRQRDDESLLSLVKASFNKGRRVYGYRRVHADLRNHCGKSYRTLNA